MERLRLSVKIWIGAMVLFVVMSCGSAETPSLPSPSSEAFGSKWYQGKAELNRFTIDQARYGDLRKGDAVLMFVTEDFRTDRFVKLEDYDGDGRASAVPILKMNFMVTFLTGVYPYSVMTSVFSPVDTRRYPRALKASNSVQEWCGHVYGQFTYRDHRYRYDSHSYFENEADETFDLEDALLEDDIWVRIRLNPGSLPEGAIRIIPGMMQGRFLHRKPTVETAVAGASEWTRDGDSLVTYKIVYQTFQRELAITFRKAFPYDIVEFEGTYVDGFGDRARTLRTHAVRTHTIMLDYWTKNRPADSTYRKELGLP